MLGKGLRYNEHSTNSVNPHQITVLLLKFYFFFLTLNLCSLFMYILWFNFILGSNFFFLLFLGIVMYDNEFETEENII